MARSPQAARAQLGVILPLVLTSLSFDPNYAEDMNADEGGEDEPDADDEECAAEHTVAICQALHIPCYTLHQTRLGERYPHTLRALLLEQAQP